MRRPSRSTLAVLFERHDAALAVARLSQQGFQAVEVPQRDDAGAVRSARIVRRRLRHEAARVVDEGVQVRARNHAVIDRDAHLAALDHLRADHRSHVRGRDRAGRQQRGTFAAEFQRDRGEVPGGLRHHQPSHLRAAGVEQVVPRHRGEGTRQRQAAGHHMDEVGVKGVRHHVGQQRGAGGRVLAGLHDDPVPGGEHLDHRPHGQVEREIPRHDVADHALRLALHVGARGAMQPRIRVTGHGAASIRFKMLQHVAGAAHHTQHFDQVGRGHGMCAEIVCQRLRDPGPVGSHHADKRLQPSAAFGQAGISIGGEGRALHGERRMQYGNLRIVLQRRFRVGGHHGHVFLRPLLAIDARWPWTRQDGPSFRYGLAPGNRLAAESAKDGSSGRAAMQPV